MQRRLLMTGLATTLGLLAAASPASAEDWGGSGPSIADCTPASATVWPVGPPVTLKYPSGEYAGRVEIRWSDRCPSSNWARLTSTVTSSRLVLSIKERDRSWNGAWADDYNTSQNWTRTILLASPNSTVCAYADIYSYKGRASGVICR